MLYRQTRKNNLFLPDQNVVTSACVLIQSFHGDILGKLVIKFYHISEKYGRKK